MNTIAIVNGEVVTAIPQDLYIPPDALRIFLETFEGPLDLLLYLIRRQNLDILQISITTITLQYMQYISTMQTLRLELAGEYLLMAATLAEIKSRLLLPKQIVGVEEDPDPKATLIKRLLEYERFKEAAQKIEGFPRLDRDIFVLNPALPPLQQVHALPSVTLKELLVVFTEAIQRSEMFSTHTMTKEPLSVEERMAHILTRLKTENSISFVECFSFKEGRMGIVVSLLAILELIKASLVWVSQTHTFGMMYLSLHTEALEAPLS